MTDKKERMEGSKKDVHGLLGKYSWPNPYCVAKSEKPNRQDQGNMTTASEYLDEPDVLEEKIEIFAKLIKDSKCVCAYTGAGLSRAAGIGDYASKAKNSIMNDVPKLESAFDAKPTFTHQVLSKMEEKGLLHIYIQQNHDGLPQKAGFPQEKINEIHGAWYDPSNQVVQFSESLRSDLFQWMTEYEKKIDLTICLGTSLSGMNADRMAITPAKNFKNSKKGNGTVMINLQKTKIDKDFTIRIWSKIDDAFKLLVKKLSLDMSTIRSYPTFDSDVFYIPYDEKGQYLGKDTKKLMKLDFSNGSKVKIIHPDSSSYGFVGEMYKKWDDHYTIYMQARKNEKKCLYAIGNWMIDMALRGACEQFSYVNENPEFDVKDLKKVTKIIDNKTVEKIIIVKDKILTIGNTHLKIDEDVHKWCCYVKSNNDDIEKVKFILHPTFKDNIITVSKSPFQIEKVGWGIFDIQLKITFKDGEEKETKHKLSFENDITENNVKFE